MTSAIVIGAGPGIGTSVARRFAREGLAVAVLARSQATVDAARARLNPTGAAALGLTADVTDEAGLKAALDEVTARHGVPDVLVYNAAHIQSDPFGALDARGLLDTLAVNVVGAMTAIAHLGPAMARAARGTILLTGGMPEPLPESTSLSVSKAALRGLTALLAREYGPAGVHVATVTVAGAVAPLGPLDPDEIADVYWRLHTQAPEAWEREVLFPAMPPQRTV
jgi:NAD(P)-dependent dehydrogenase (short-subunit alcohol dehydrogenase family)